MNTCHLTHMLENSLDLPIHTYVVVVLCKTVFPTQSGISGTAPTWHNLNSMSHGALVSPTGRFGLNPSFSDSIDNWTDIVHGNVMTPHIEEPTKSLSNYREVIHDLWAGIAFFEFPQSDKGTNHPYIFRMFSPYFLKLFWSELSFVSNPRYQLDQF